MVRIGGSLHMYSGDLFIAHTRGWFPGAARPRPRSSHTWSASLTVLLERSTRSPRCRRATICPRSALALALVSPLVVWVASLDLTINVTCCDSANNCNTAPDASCVQGNWVAVQVQYPLTTFWPVPASGTYQTSSTMRIELPGTVS